MQSIVFKDSKDVINAIFSAINLKDIPLQNAVLVNIAQDGLEYAQALASELEVPMEVLFTQTISAPLNPECSIAAVSESMDIVMNDELVRAFSISLEYVYGEAQRQYDEAILPTIYRLRKGREHISLENKDVLLFDIGIETGFRINVAIKTCVNMGARSLYVISPIMPKNIYQQLCDICDEVCCPYPIDNYVSTSHYYPNLSPLSDTMFKNILNTNTTKDT